MTLLFAYGSFLYQSRWIQLKFSESALLNGAGLLQVTYMLQLEATETVLQIGWKQRQFRNKILYEKYKEWKGAVCKYKIYDIADMKF